MLVSSYFLWFMALTFYFRMANLSYIKNFRLCSSVKDELGYCLTSIEAAIEYIRQGNLSDRSTVSYS